MTRPLYKTAAQQPTARGSDGNAGLWYDKFCNQWRVNGSHWSMSAGDGCSNPKLAWINSLAAAGGLGIRGQLDEFASRLLQLVQGRAGEAAVFTTESRFVTGLGRSHPIENGFAWHPTLGTPYLPGTAVKGLVRAWVREQAETRPDPTTLSRLLGEGGRSGGVSFLDAVPIVPVQVEADVMTPHYAGWDESALPGDWCSPNPIPFLVTAVGTPFLFGLIPGRVTTGSDLDTVMGWLGSALTWAGAGAKTSVGYGRMARDEAATARLHESVRREREQRDSERREQERLASLSPLDRELDELAQSEKGLAGYLVWLKAIESDRWVDDSVTQRAVLHRVKAEMERLGKWKPSSAKKRPDKDKDHQRTLHVMKLLGRFD